MSSWTPDEIRMSFIREFSIGNALSNSTSEAQRECIRINILSKCRDKLPFFDSGMTYKQAYELLYSKPLELRRYPRDETVMEDEEEDEDV